MYVSSLFVHFFVCSYQRAFQVSNNSPGGAAVHYVTAVYPLWTLLLFLQDHCTYQWDLVPAADLPSLEVQQTCPAVIEHNYTTSQLF